MKPYINRVLDEVIKEKLEVTGAVVIKGPKWCGKTRTAKEFANSQIDLQNVETADDYKKIASNDISLLLDGEKPRLIDEWQEIPKIWNAVRSDVDNKGDAGLYILTGSATPHDQKTKHLHSGIGRMSHVVMKPMTLYESGDSNGTISLKEIISGSATIRGQKSDVDYQKLAYLTCRGGWPDAINKDNEKHALAVAKEYFNALCEADIMKIDNVARNPHLARHILKSYARQVSTIDSDKTLIDDIKYNFGDVSDTTIYDYLKVFKRLYVIDETQAWNPNLRSKTAIRTSPKKGFVDPSIGVAAMDISPKELAMDPNTFGLFFENLVNRDLSVYVQKIGGYVKHYRDRSGLECDHVIHLHNGKFGLVQTKLGTTEIEQGINKLREINKLIKEANKDKKTVKEPDFMMVIHGYDLAYTTEDGIYVVPIGCLKD